MTSDLSFETVRRALQAGDLATAIADLGTLRAEGQSDIPTLDLAVGLARKSGDAAMLEAALEHFIDAVPAALPARYDLARMRMESDRFQDAEPIVRELVALRPDDPLVHTWMGGLLAGMFFLPEAEWHFRRAIALAGPQAHLLANLARNLTDQGRLADAEAVALQAHEVAPGIAAPLLQLAEICEQRGALDDAATWLDKAEARLPDQGGDISTARITLLARGGAWREALAQLDAKADLRGPGLLVRGRLRDRAGRYGEAWEDVVAGKAALAEAGGRHYDRAVVEEHFAAVARAFSAPFWRQVPRASVRGDVAQPIFILGFPRSGTTMTEQILASHSAIRPGGELPFTDQLRDFAQTLLGRGQAFPAGLGDLAAADHHYVPGLLRDFYLGRAEARGLAAPGARFFVDKMPLTHPYLPLLRLAFPEAPMIFIQRHPLDILVSVMQHDMTHGFHCGYHIANAAHCFAAASQVFAHYRDNLKLQTHILRYEDFVANQGAETERLMAYVGLPLEPAQMRFHESARHAATPSYAQVREPVHTRSVEKWRRYEKDLAPILPMMADAIADGGYTV